MKIGSYKITFGNILGLWGIIYLSLSFLTGEVIFQMPNSWFVTWMAGIFQKMDVSGFFHVWSGQSQGFNYLYFLIWKPAIWLAGEQSYFALVFAAMWGIMSIGGVFLSTYLFYKIVAHFSGEAKGVILGTVLMLFFMTMPQWYTFVDSVAIAGLLAAIYLVLKERAIGSGLVLGITATFKPFGLLFLPVLLKSEFLSRKTRVTMIATSIVSFGGLLLPFAVGNFKIFMSSFNWQSSRPPWESLYAFFMWVFKRPFPNSPYFQDASGAAIKDWGLTGITPSTTVMTTAVPSMHTWWSLVFLLLMTMVVMVFLTIKRVSSKEDMVVGTLFMLGAYFMLFYGWSAQFFFWLVPFLLMIFSPLVSIGMRTLVLLEYPFFYAIYMSRVAPEVISAAPGLTVSMTATLTSIGALGYWGTVIIRTLLILGVCTLAWLKLPSKIWKSFPTLP